MRRDARGEELRARLEDELAARLGPAGWERLIHRTVLGSVTALVRPVGDGIEAVVEVRGRLEGSPALVVEDVYIGVGYAPLRRLAPLLGADETTVVLLAGPEQPGFAEIAIAGDGELGAAAEQLARLILERGASMAERYPTLEALLAEFDVACDEDEDEDEDEWGLAGRAHHKRALLLAAAKRFEEAEEALDRARNGSGREDDDVLARRLQRWIDGRGDPSLIPDEPPPDRLESAPPRPAAGELWGEVRGRAAALDAVKRHTEIADREARRELLLGELARRGLTPEPRWIELQLEHLEMSDAERWRQSGQFVAKVGAGLLRAVLERKLPDLTRPEWLEPPARAGYAMPSSRRYVAVELDAGVEDFLSRVLRSLPGSLDEGGSLGTWLRFDPEPRTAASELAVCVGEGRVGRVGPAEVAPYLPHMDAAATRDEVPRLDGRLTRLRRSRRMLLEIPLPR